MNDIKFALQIGDVSSNGQARIVDEDKLCFLVLSENKGSSGLRTISKALLKEFVDYYRLHPNASSLTARENLSGNSNIDKFEYGYNSTLATMAKMVIENEKTRNYISKSESYYPNFQVIYYGAPGTGKSYEIARKTSGQRVIRTTFHPDSDYSTFVGTYKPSMSKNNVKTNPKLNINELAQKLKEYYNDSKTGKVEGIQRFCYDYWECLTDDNASISLKQLATLADISSNYVQEIYKYVNFCKILPKQSVEKKIIYKFVPQAFIQAYVEAWRDLNKPVFLVVEEINRGNCAQIFGDIFQLLDRNDNGYSSYEITPNEDVMLYLNEEFAENGIDEKAPDNIKSGDVMCLPPNLYIWATMNTSDQSLFPIDSAFKRRWDWKYIPINTEKEQWYIQTSEGLYSWSSFLKKINFEIGDTTSSEDKKLGFYFCKAQDNIIDAEKFVSKVLFYIYNDVFKDYGFDSKEFFKKDGKVMSFQDYYNMDGTINEENVTIFLENLNVEHNKANNEQEDDIDENSPNGKTQYGKHKRLKSVTFNDGLFIDSTDRTKFDIYLETIKKIGLEKAEPIVGDSKYRRLGCPLISKQKDERILNSNNKYVYVEEDEYNIIKGISDNTKIAVLQLLNEKLNLGLTIDFD